MDHFEEQETKIYEDAGIKLAEAKRKRLYTWYDIEKIKEDYESKLTCANGSCDDYANELEREKNRWHWGDFFAGVGIALCFAMLLSIFIHNL